MKRIKKAISAKIARIERDVEDLKSLLNIPSYPSIEGKKITYTTPTLRNLKPTSLKDAVLKVMKVGKEYSLNEISNELLNIGLEPSLDELVECLSKMKREEKIITKTKYSIRT